MTLLWGKMWIYCGIILLPLAVASVFNGECSAQIPADEPGDSVNLMDLNGTVWTPIRHNPQSTPRFNLFDASPYMLLDCVEFHFQFIDGYIHLHILPTNCTAADGDYIEESCWMEYFILARYDNRSEILHDSSIPTSPANCARPYTHFYFLTPDIEQVLVLWSCFDFRNGSFTEGLWILSRRGVEVDFQTFRLARKMINSVVPLEMWIRPRNSMELCSCQSRFGSYPCTTDEECLKDSLISFFGASVVGDVGNSPSFLMCFFFGVVTFAVATVAFIRLSGISECLCNENYNAF